MIWLMFKAGSAERYGAAVKPTSRRIERMHGKWYAVWGWPTPEWAERGEPLVHRAWSELTPNIPWSAVCGGGFYD